MSPEDDDGSDFVDTISNYENAGWEQLGDPGSDGSVILSKDLGPVIEYIQVTPGSPPPIEYLGTFAK